MIGEALYNGTFVEDARIPLDDLAFTYGYGVYETITVRHGAPYFLRRHASRLLASAHLLGINPRRTEQDVEEDIRTLMDSLSEEAYNVKLLLVGERADLWVFAAPPLFLSKKAYRDGVPVVLLQGERFLPTAKTLGMLSSYIAYRAAKACGAYDALLVADGNVTEGTRTNLFCTDGTTLFTPPAADVLPGVVRTLLVERLTMPVRERRIEESELRAFAGWFLTSTSAGVLPVRSIDGAERDIPPIVRRVQDAWKKIREKEN